MASKGISKLDKREAARQFKERKVAAGAYAVRCLTDGAVWVGITRNLDAARNACWFSLRMRAHRVASLQAAWDVHGESAFTFEILESLDEDTHALAVNDLLKTLKGSWMARCEANRSALHHDVFVDRCVPQLVWTADGHLAIFENRRPVKPLFVADLKQVASRAKYGVLPKLIADFNRRKGSDLDLHELFDSGGIATELTAGYH